MKEILMSSEHFGFVLSIFIFLLAIQIKLWLGWDFLNPLLLSTIMIVGILLLSDIPYEEYKQGAGLLNYFLTPATVCLAIPLYKQWNLLKNNFKAVILGILAGTLSSIVSILLLGLAFHLPNEHISTLLPKSITTAIGMGISEEMGGYVTLTVAAIVLTGILGSILSDLVFRIFPIHHPIAKGLALGTSAHAIGTAKALEMGEVEGAMSSLAIVVAGILTVILVPIVNGVALG
jgi:murein hydrolase effector lrgB